jgi:antitoxin Phd
MTKIRRRRRNTKGPHRVWQLQEAKARFSELINEVERDGCHTITKNGHPVAVVISTHEFEKMRKPKNTLLDFFREAPLPDFDFEIQRNKDLGRDIDL